MPRIDRETFDREIVPKLSPKIVKEEHLAEVGERFDEIRVRTGGNYETPPASCDGLTICLDCGIIYWPYGLSEATGVYMKQGDEKKRPLCRSCVERETKRQFADASLLKTYAKTNFLL